MSEVFLAMFEVFLAISDLFLARLRYTLARCCLMYSVNRRSVHVSSSCSRSVEVDSGETRWVGVRVSRTDTANMQNP